MTVQLTPIESLRAEKGEPKGTGPRVRHEHGTVGRYRLKCRCTECKSSWNKYMQSYRVKNLDKLREYHREWMKRVRRENPKYQEMIKRDYEIRKPKMQAMFKAACGGARPPKAPKRK